MIRVDADRRSAADRHDDWADLHLQGGRFARGVRPQ